MNKLTPLKRYPKRKLLDLDKNFDFIFHNLRRHFTMNRIILIVQVRKAVFFKDNFEKGKVTKRLQKIHILNTNVRTVGAAYCDHLVQSDNYKRMKTLTKFTSIFS